MILTISANLTSMGFLYIMSSQSLMSHYKISIIDLIPCTRHDSLFPPAEPTGKYCRCKSWVYYIKDFIRCQVKFKVFLKFFIFQLKPFYNKGIIHLWPQEIGKQIKELIKSSGVKQEIFLARLNNIVPMLSHYGTGWTKPVSGKKSRQAWKETGKKMRIQEAGSETFLKEISYIHFKTSSIKMKTKEGGLLCVHLQNSLNWNSTAC